MRRVITFWFIPLTAMSLALLLLAAGLLFVVTQKRDRDPIAVSSHGPTVQQIQALNDLTVAKVHVADVLTASGEGYQGCWIIKGDVLVAVDLAKARLENRDPAQRRATIVLPVPRIISARVNHEATRTYDVSKNTWKAWKWGNQGVLRDSAMFHAQRLIERAAEGDVDLQGQARRTTELLVGNLFQPLNWAVDIRWEDDRASTLPASVPPSANASSALAGGKERP
jgi:hypothetical protein